MASAMKNPSLLHYGKGDIRVEDTQIPVPKDDEVLIKVHSVGVCGSDIHMFEEGTIGKLKWTHPFKLGHEASGVVVKCGQKVTNLKEGDNICMEPMVACGKCRLCTTGNYHGCVDGSWGGCPSWDGFLSRYAVHLASYCFKLPETVAIEHGAFVEPLSVGVYACERAGVTLNSKVLITGAGPVGLATAMAAKGMGAEVCVTEIRKNPLDVARKMGVAHTILCDTKDNNIMFERIVDKLGQRPEISIDCTGSQGGVALACMATESAGVVSLVGLGHHNSVLPIDDIILRGLDLRGVSKYNHSFPAAIRLMATGCIDVDALISHRFPIDKAVDAFKFACTRSADAMKVFVNI